MENLLNKKANNIWKKQNGENQMYAYDFTDKKIAFDSFEDPLSNFCWTIYNVSDDEWITINCSTFKKIPANIELGKVFSLDGENYNFHKTQDGYDVIKEEEYIKINTNLLQINDQIKKEFLVDFKEVNDMEDENIDLNNSLEKEIIYTEDDLSSTHPKKNLSSSEKVFNEIENKNSLNFSNFQQEVNNENKNEVFFKYWNSIFDNEILGYDFAGKLILKNEFRTNSKYAWDIDFFDRSIDDNKKYIASRISIKNRNSKKEFEIDGIIYNVVHIDDNYRIINSQKSENIITIPRLLNKKIDNYFGEPSKIIIPYEAISSAYISLSNFPIEHLEKLRSLLFDLFYELDVFLDLFIYAENNQNNLFLGKTCYIRVFFKSKNKNDYLSIFDIVLTIKNILKMVIIKLVSTFNLPKNISFDILLENHLLKFPFISWFTNHEINENTKYIAKPNTEEFVVDKFYMDSFITTKGENLKKFFIPHPLMPEKFICNLDIEKILNFVSKLSFLSKYDKNK
ncbi:MAG: hypothetical protein ACRCRZ_00420 [Metamycoplasmataceae bacterium]